ncbi:MAG: hypothetical protein IPG59_22695 [Candidatus Melainabacteria bacterium]|nr:MAG: hypothetical protein IPG59_22695 [Candidatus Melainabacteria bacterium]
MTSDKNPETEKLQIDSPEKSEVAQDSVVAGVNKVEHQSMFFEIKAEGNQDSPSDMSLRALSPDDPEYANLIANRFEIVDDSVERSNLKKTTEKLKPKDGTRVLFQDLLKNYSTPFLDAYFKSKSLTDGQPGKSKTLEQIIDRIKTCPWFDQIKIHFDSNAKNPEYDRSNSTITIDPTASISKQIETFAHEAFHSTHQGIKALYLDGQVTDLNKYLAIKSDLELGAFISEIQVHNEITKNILGSEPVTFANISSHGVKLPDLDLVSIFHAKGKDGLREILIDKAIAGMQIDGNTRPSTYRNYFASGHKTYLESHAENLRKLNSWFNSKPEVKSKIVNGNF